MFKDSVRRENRAEREEYLLGCPFRQRRRNPVGAEDNLGLPV